MSKHLVEVRNTMLRVLCNYAVTLNHLLWFGLIEPKLLSMMETRVLAAQLDISRGRSQGTWRRCHAWWGAGKIL